MNRGTIGLVALWMMLTAIPEQGAEALASACAGGLNNCCLPGPAFSDPVYGLPSGAWGALNDGTVAITTHLAVDPPDPALIITDLSAPPSAYCSPRYTLPAWDRDHLGTVFGLTLDQHGNIYVTHTSCYNQDRLGLGAVTGGSIYRIDAVTGAVTLFAQLPNYKDTSVTPPSESWPGLGNITFDCVHNQFFVTSIEDGRIWCLRSNNPLNGSPADVQLSPYDPWVADPGPNTVPAPPTSPSPGWAPLGERLWGIDYHDDRVYFSRWSQDTADNPGAGPNSIWSVALDANGVIIGSSLQIELTLPGLSTSFPYSNPVSDITFNAAGYMLLAERGVLFKTYVAYVEGRALEFFCDNGEWLSTFGPPINHGIFDVGDAGFVPSCQGGVAYDETAVFGNGIAGRTWASGIQLVSNSVAGLQGFPPTGGNWTNSTMIDLNCVTTGDKTETGDVDIPCRRGALMGRKFIDLDGDCVKDGNESFASGWTLKLSGPNNYASAATTDGQGVYSFANLGAGTYTVCEVTQPGYVIVCPAGGCTSVTVSGGQTVTNVDFANAPCQGSCVAPNRCTAGWWKFDECSGTATVDAAGASNGILVGNPTWTGTSSGCGLDFAAVGSYVQIPHTAALDVSTGSFSLGAWIRTSAPDPSVRTIIDKRQVSNAQGYALWLFDGRPGLQLASNGSWLNYWDPNAPDLRDGIEHAVGVCVSRNPASPGSNSIQMYVDGVNVATWSGAQVSPATLTNTHDVWIGEQAWSPGIPFQGVIDNVLFWNCCVDASYFQQIANAGGGGFCKFRCSVPSVISSPGPTVKTKLTICNYSNVSTTYAWTIAGLPAGTNCTKAGPTQFSPAAGNVSVLPGQCQDVDITITLPSGLTWLDSTCYQVTVLNQTEGGCCETQGQINQGVIGVEVGPIWWVDPWVQTPVVGQVINHDSLDVAVHYTLVARGRDGGDSAILLNGLPPGTPVEGVLFLPAGSQTPLQVDVTFAEYRPFDAEEIVLLVETLPGLPPQEVGVIEVGCARHEAPADLSESDALSIAPRLVFQIAPNPVRDHAALRFSLAAAQDVEISIYDVAGRLVRALHRGSLEPGSQELRWDAKDAQGARAESGIYFARVRIGRERQSSKLIVIR